MSWVKLDDHFPEHEKVNGLHDRAFRFHVAALCYCARNRTDGLITARSAGVVAAILNTQTKRWIDELTAAGLWTADEGSDGWRINDYLDYNPSAEQIRADRDAARERMRSLRSSRERSGEQPGERSPARSPRSSVTPSRPLVGDNPQRQPTTWQPALGSRNPTADIQRQIANGAISDHVDLEAELAAHRSLTEEDRAQLRALIDKEAAA